ncbi:DndE family protein [Clostridium thermobutyricum]|uniref:DndE family protein n=1 Tax=Clostridium thermobutyricum TaxID=29372 RepID=UPI003F51E0FA
MGFRLKTSKQTKEIFEELSRSTNLKPFALCKISIALSLNSEESIDTFESDQNGLELQRATVTGEFDTIYKCLMEAYSEVSLSDDDYFPNYTKKHIDRGAKLLQSKYKYSGGNLEKFLTKLSF